MGLPDRDPREIDHLNGNGLDCRRENMRIVSHAENQQNRRSFGKTSQYRGVCFNAARGKWLANGKTGKHRFQKQYDTELEAHEAITAWRKVFMPHATD